MLLWEHTPILPKTSFLYQELNLFRYKRSAPCTQAIVCNQNTEYYDIIYNQNN